MSHREPTQSAALIVRGPIEVFDKRFLPLVPREPELTRLCSGARWSEGPVWMFEDQSVLWSDIPNNRMLRWSERDGMSVWRSEVEFTNGHTRDIDGSLLSCSHGLRAVTRGPVGGQAEVVIKHFRGKRLNSPNDITVKSDGTIWFTDPPYGILIDGEGHRAVPELDGCYVFRFDPGSGSLDIVTDLPRHPNGLAFSPDESVLYVADSSAVMEPEANRCVFAFDVVDGRSLVRGRKLVEIRCGVPDGLRVDQRGFLYVATYAGVEVFAPDGAAIAKIVVPERVANCTFGGINRDQLFICAATSLYRIHLLTRGVQFP